MNKRLAFGLAILIALCVLAALSGFVAPHEQGYSKSIFVDVVKGKEVLVVAPEAPGKHLLLGSDFWGRDLFSEMVHGLPWTLGIVFLTATSRCLIGLGAGLVAGSRGRNRLRKRGFSPLSAMPSFIIAAFVLYPITINSPLPPLGLFFVQAFVLVVVEIAPVAASFGAKTAVLLDKPFVEAARTAGADRRWIVAHHLLPFIVVDFIEALPVQALSVAGLVGKLGIVKIFIGGTTRNYDPIIHSPARSEWLGLLGNYYNTMFTEPWLFFAPFVGWLLVLACTALLASGVRTGYASDRRIASLSEKG